MSALKKSTTLSVGLAMFSMFFGAGNIVFPLFVGQQAQDQTLLAILGLLLTAVCVPFAGVIGMILYDGDPQKFFGRVGRVPGTLLTAFILCLIGPFGGMPRCVTLSYSTLSTHFSGISLPVFSVLAAVAIFVCCCQKRRVLPVLGYWLTPILLLSLGAIVCAGLFNGLEARPIQPASWDNFAFGLQEGYNTMDLLASFFFTGVVMAGLRQQGETSSSTVFWQALKCSAIGALLLSTVYVAFSQVAAGLGPQLASVPKDKLLGVVSAAVLGPYAGMVTSVAMALTCLTTAIALALVFAEAIQKQLFDNRISYVQALLITLLVNCATSMFEFTVIIEWMFPLLQIIYPGLIVLTVVNIAWKLLPQKFVAIYD